MQRANSSGGRGKIPHRGRWTPIGVLTSVLRLAMGLLFCIAGAFKLADLNSFFASLLQWQMFDANFLWYFSWGLALTEFLFGLWLLSGLAASAAACFGLFLIAAFSSALLLARMRNIDVDCACFGPLQIGSTYAAWFLRNAIFAIIFLWIAWRCRPRKRMIQNSHGHP